MGSPLIFVEHGTEDELLDKAAIGVEANPFAGRWAAWTELGLDGFLADVESLRRVSFQTTKKGPEDLPGLVLSVAAMQRDSADTVLHSAQQWVRVDKRIWVCTSDGLDPDSLLRHKLLNLPTHPVLLGDNLVWEVPRIRRTVCGGWLHAIPDHQSELPHRVQTDWRTGQTLLTPLPRYQMLWLQSQRLCYALTGEGADVSWGELLTFCLAVLGLRYRFTEHMHRAFPDILTSEGLWRVARAACGFDLIEAEIKKKEQELVSAN